jgi:hypothetical protein
VKKRGTSTSRHSRPGACRRLIRLACVATEGTRFVRVADAGCNERRVHALAATKQLSPSEPRCNARRQGLRALERNQQFWPRFTDGMVRSYELSRQ